MRGEGTGRLRRLRESSSASAVLGVAVVTPLHWLLFQEGWLRAVVFAVVVTAVGQLVDAAERTWRRRHPRPPEHVGAPDHPGAIPPLGRLPGS